MRTTIYKKGKIIPPRSILHRAISPQQMPLRIEQGGNIEPKTMRTLSQHRDSYMEECSGGRSAKNEKKMRGIARAQKIILDARKIIVNATYAQRLLYIVRT